MKTLLRVIGILALAYVAGFLLFLYSLPEAASNDVHADGIVALTGGDQRLDAAVALLERHAAKRLLITGVYETTTKEDLKRLSHGGARFDCCADIGYAAEDTHGNAEEAADWTRAHRYKSLIVVTARYHMPRSLTEFGAEMPGIRLVPYPVEPESTDVAGWWRAPGRVAMLHNEYAKYLASLVTTAWTKPEGADHARRASI